MTRPRFRPQVESLEDRAVPSATYTNGSFTLDFVPNGTSTLGLSSTFYSTFSSNVNTAETEILRAFQTWADAANINLGLVTGSGAGGSTPYSDPTLSGNIRIAAAPLAGTVVAVSTPIGPLSTNSGLMALNSTSSFSVAGSSGTYDLYSVALHEAGVILGLPENTTPSSVMDELYAGTRTGLSSADVAAIRAIYGPRPADAWAGNNSTATAYSVPNSTPLLGQLLSTSQTDYYKFTNASSSTTTTISLSDTGLSLLEAKMTLLSPSGAVLGTATVTDPRSNNLSLTLSGHPAGTYYVEVQGANTSVSGMGEYALGVSTSGATAPSPASGTTATSSLSLGLDNNNYSDALASAGQVKQYTATTPASGVLGSSSNMIVSVSTKVAGFSPCVTVSSPNGTALQTVLLVDQNGVMTIEVPNVSPATKYTIGVSSASKSTGAYNLLFDFSSAPVDLATVTGSVSAQTPNVAGLLQVNQDQAIHFVVSATSTPTTPTTALELTVRNASGTVVAKYTIPDGTGLSADVLLPEGDYSVELTAVSSSGTIATLNYILTTYVTSDATGVAAANPTSTYTEPSPPPGVPATTAAQATPLGGVSLFWIASFFIATTPTGGTILY